MNLKKATLAALTAVATTTAPALAQSNHSHHVDLAKAVISTGVEFKVNPAQCFEEKGTFGWYWAAKNELVICQENATSTREVRWTEEDYDTLRHEAQHLIQDCMDGVLQGRLESAYQDPIRLAKEVLGTGGMRQVAKAYSDASDHVIVMELEAFSVAAMNNPTEQVDDIRRFCF